MSTETNRKKCLIVTILMLSGLLGTDSVSLAQADTWTEKAPMPTARSFFSASTVDGKIYAIGGHGGRSVVEEYDPATDTWTKKASLPTLRQWLSTSVVNGKIYVIGGTSITYQPALSKVEEYDLATDTWTEKAPMLTPRFGLSTSVVDGKIYAIGGFIRATTTTDGSEPPSSAVEEYDPATDTWTEKAPMPTARSALSTSVVDGKIYALGGSTYRTGLSTVEAYDPATDTWTTKAPMPTARTTFLATSAVNGIIYVIGGVNGETAFSTVEAYEPATDIWTEKTSMPRARGFLATSVVGGKIYAIGGRPTSHGANLSTVEEYDPGLAASSLDFNGDGIVDSADMCIMIDHWHTDYPLCDIAPQPFGDGMVNVQDLTLLSEHLFEYVDDLTLIAHWALDETEGMFAADSVSDNDAVVLGGAVWLPGSGQVDGALQLDGVSGCAIAPLVLNPADGPFSVLAWIKGGAPGQVVVSQQSASNWLELDVGGNLMTELKSSDHLAGPLFSEAVIADGQWHRIGLVWDGSNRTLYVDGVAVAEDTQPGLEGSQNGLYIGVDKNYTAGTYFSGMIDDVRIYNRTVSP